MRSGYGAIIWVDQAKLVDAQTQIHEYLNKSNDMKTLITDPIDPEIYRAMEDKIVILTDE